jgi:hypothetical protein
MDGILPDGGEAPLSDPPSPTSRPLVRSGTRKSVEITAPEGGAFLMEAPPWPSSEARRSSAVPLYKSGTRKSVEINPPSTDGGQASSSSSSSEPPSPTGGRRQSALPRSGSRRVVAEGDGDAPPCRQSFSLEVNMAPPSHQGQPPPRSPSISLARAGSRKAVEVQGQGGEGAGGDEARRKVDEDAPLALPRSPSFSRSPSQEV